MKPTAQAVGRKWEMNKLRRSERMVATQPRASPPVSTGHVNPNGRGRPSSIGVFPLLQLDECQAMPRQSQSQLAIFYLAGFRRWKVRGPAQLLDLGLCGITRG